MVWTDKLVWGRIFYAGYGDAVVAADAGAHPKHPRAFFLYIAHAAINIGHMTDKIPLAIYFLQHG